MMSLPPAALSASLQPRVPVLPKKITCLDVIQMIPRIFAGFFTHGITETSQKNTVLSPPSPHSDTHFVQLVTKYSSPANKPAGTRVSAISNT